MNELNVSQLKQILRRVADEIIANEPYLTEVDAIIGDGDHGTGMKRGFTALGKMLDQTQFQTVDALFKSVGIELVKTMGGASGVIFGTMFTGGLHLLRPSTAISLRELADYLEGGLQAIQKRGKAKAGQKTMLDALIPAIASLKDSAANAEGFPEAMEKAYQAAAGGAEASKAMKSMVGRSKNFQDATYGYPDPGAISTSLIFKAFCEGVRCVEQDGTGNL